MSRKNKAISEYCIDGYITVYLSLILAVLLSLCLTLIEGARSSAIKLEGNLAAQISADSILAEYHRELASQYNIFAIDDSYGTETAELKNLQEHFEKYLYKNTTTEDVFLADLLYRDFIGIKVDDSSVNGVLFLTDGKGEVFRRRAYEAAKDDVGLTLLESIIEWADIIQNNGLETMNLTETLKNLEGQTTGAQEEVSEEDKIRDDDEPEPDDIYEETGTDKNSDPAGLTLSSIDSGILWMVIDDANNLSEKCIEPEELVCARIENGKANKGNLEIEDQADLEDILERFVFQEYLLKYMGCYGDTDGEDALEYQIEYIIAGKDSDIANLKSVAARIFALRYAADYLYILSDEQKVQTAQDFAEVIAYFTYTEELIDVYKNIFLLVWSCAEARFDTKVILEGNRIPLIKDEDTWHSTILNGLLCTIPDTADMDEEGLSYQDYLRVFMLLMAEDTLTMRAMDIVEADIRLTQGNSDFRMDACIDTLVLEADISSVFGYRYTYKLKRRYE